MTKVALPWPVWPSGLGTMPQSKSSLVHFPVRARAWVAGLVPSRGVCEATNRCFSLTLMFLSLSLFPSCPTPCSLLLSPPLPPPLSLTSMSMSLGEEFFKGAGHLHSHSSTIHNSRTSGRNYSDESGEVEFENSPRVAALPSSCLLIFSRGLLRNANASSRPAEPNLRGWSRERALH